MAYTLWNHEGIRVDIKELHHFVDGFVVGPSFDLWERPDGELGCDIVNYICLTCHRGWFVPRAVVLNFCVLLLKNCNYY